MNDKPNRGEPKKILVRGVNWLGDSVMSTPALLHLRATCPDAQITLLTPAKLAGLWPDHPAINEVLSFAPNESVFSLARRLKGHAFDTAVVFPNSPRSALEVFLARIPTRVGLRRPGRNLLLTHRIATPPHYVATRKRSPSEIRQLISTSQTDLPASPREAHQLYHYLHLVRSFFGGATDAPAPFLKVAPERISAVRERFHWPDRSKPDSLIFGLNAGAEYGPAKRWPEDRFIETARRIEKHFDNCTWVLFGGPADDALASRIAQGLRPRKPLPASGAPAFLNLAGKTTLSELCAALASCDLLLTNDSGPMHVAAAVGTPVVALFGSTNPRLTAPGVPGDKRHVILSNDAPCAPCFLRECPIDFRCLNGISVETVVRAIQQIVAVDSSDCRPGQ